MEAYIGNEVNYMKRTFILKLLLPLSFLALLFLTPFKCQIKLEILAAHQ